MNVYESTVQCDCYVVILIQMDGMETLQFYCKFRFLSQSETLNKAVKHTSGIITRRNAFIFS